jgi:hypothetical protein
MKTISTNANKDKTLAIAQNNFCRNTQLPQPFLASFFNPTLHHSTSRTPFNVAPSSTIRNSR